MKLTGKLADNKPRTYMYSQVSATECLAGKYLFDLPDRATLSVAGSNTVGVAVVNEVRER